MPAFGPNFFDGEDRKLACKHCGSFNLEWELNPKTGESDHKCKKID